MAPQPMNAKRTLDILSSGHAPLPRVDLLTFTKFQREGDDHGLEKGDGRGAGDDRVCDDR